MNAEIKVQTSRLQKESSGREKYGVCLWHMTQDLDGKPRTTAENAADTAHAAFLKADFSFSSGVGVGPYGVSR